MQKINFVYGLVKKQEHQIGKFDCMVFHEFMKLNEEARKEKVFLEFHEYVKLKYWKITGEELE